MRKLSIAVLLVICLPLALTSCATPINLRDRAIVQIMGIDYENEKYKVHLQEFLPSSSEKGAGGGENSSEYVSAEGETIFDAIKNAEAKDGNQVFYGHCRLYIIGKSALEKGVGQVTEFMNSNYQLSLNSSVLATEGKAEDILSAKLFSGMAPNISVESIERCGKAPNTTVIDLLTTMYNLNGSGVLPLVSLKDKDNAVIEKCVILKDYKSYVTLNDEQTMGLVWLSGKISNAVLTSEHDGSKLSVGVVSESADINLTTDNNKVTVNVKIKAKGNVSENAVISSKHVNLKQIEEAEKDIKEIIEKDVKSAFKKVVTEGKTDVFYLLQRLKKADGELYNKLKDSDDWLSKINLNVLADFTVRHSGVGVR